MRLKSYLVGLAGAVALLASAATAQSAPAAFGPRDNGHRVRLASPTFTVGLPNSAGTGYSWRFQRGPSHGVALVSQTTVTAPRKPSPLVMTGGRLTQVLTLRATAPRGIVVIGNTPPGRGRAPSDMFRLRFLRAGSPHRY